MGKNANYFVTLSPVDNQLYLLESLLVQQSFPNFEYQNIVLCTQNG